MAQVAIYQGDFTGDDGGSYRWQIVEEGGTFVANLVGAGRGFLKTTWTASDKDEYSPFLVSETELRVYDTASGDLYDDLLGLLESNSDTTYIFYIRDMSGGGSGTVIWRGYVTRGNITKDEDGNQAVSVRANDGLSILSKRTFTSTTSTIFGPLETIYSGRVTYTSIMSTLLGKIGLGGSIKIASKHYPYLHGAAYTANGSAQLDAADNPWDNVYVDRHRYRVAGQKDGEADRPIKCMPVLEDVLQTWGCTLFQWNGDWHIYQVNLRGNSTIRVWTYDSAGAPVGSPNYADVTSHVVTPTTENIERSRGVLTQLENYDGVQIDYAHGEYKFMPNPGFDFGGIGTDPFFPKSWTIVGTAGSRYENLGNGDGQFISRCVQVTSASTLPTSATGTASGSVDKFVKDYCDGGSGFIDTGTFYQIADLDAFTAGTYTQLGIDGQYDGPIIKAGETLWLGIDGGNPASSESIVLSSNLQPGNEVIQFNSKTLSALADGGVFGKKSGYASSSSQYEIGADEKILVSGQYLPTKNGAPARIVGGIFSRVEAYIQVKLVGTGGTRYLNNAGGTTGFQWSSTVSWITRKISGFDWATDSWYVLDPTPFAGTITITIGPCAEYRDVFFGGTRNFTVDELRWDNVDVRPVLGPLNPNSESRSVIAVSANQTSEVTRVRDFSPMVGDAPVMPFDSGMSLDSDGYLETRDWEEQPITGAESNLSHEQLLAKVMLRSMRAPRELHSATYFDVGTLVGPYHILSRSGSDYAPRELAINWVHEHTDGTWYKVTESGFTDDSQTIYNNAAFVSSRGGVGEAASGFFAAVGGVLFADGSGAVTRTSAEISAGTVTSISVETITEPIFKDGDLIAIIGPDLEYVQARISADQDALATSLSIEDKDNPGTGVTFDNDMGYPAAIYFLEQELLTLARLGEQGFAVTVEGGPLGLVDGAQSGSLSSITVDNWNANLAAGTEVWVDADNKLTVYGNSGKTRGMKRGDTTMYFDDAPITLNLSDNQEILPEGATRRSEFKVTADAITAYIGNPGGVIATVSGTPTFDGTNTSLPVSTTLTDNLVANDPLLVYTAGGSVIKVKVKTSIASGATPIVLSDADGDQTGNISSGDKIAAGSLTGLRIDLDGIEITADTLKSSNYSASSAGWQIDGAGNAEFNNIQARGAIEITGGSGVANLADAGTLAVLDAVDTAQLVAGSVTETIIASDAITTPKIAVNAVNASKILAGSITTDKLDANAVTAAKIDVGDLFAQSISLTGSISGTGWSITSTAITMESGSIDLGAFTVSAAGAVTASNIAVTGGSISIGANFGVDASGNLTASNATISGAVTATSGSFTGSITATSGSLASLSVTGALTVGSTGSITTSGPNLSTTLTYNSGLSITGSSTTATYQASFMSLTNTSSGSTSITASASSGGASIAVDGDGSGSISVDGNVVYHPGNVGGSVTGSRGGNAALASLLSVLDGYGIISDNTTA